MPVHRDLIVALAAVACGGFVLAAEPATIALLRRLPAIDAPNTRSSHSVPTPRGGGVPIAIGLVLAAGGLGAPGMPAVRAGGAGGAPPRLAPGPARPPRPPGAVLAGLPPEAAFGPLALYLADTAWTLRRRMLAGERLTQAHRTHTYQRLCDAGWSHQRVTLATGSVTAALSLLGAASLTPYP